VRTGKDRQGRQIDRSELLLAEHRRQLKGFLANLMDPAKTAVLLALQAARSEFHC
jgi:hypothetical protein